MALSRADAYHASRRFNIVSVTHCCGVVDSQLSTIVSRMECLEGAINPQHSFNFSELLALTQQFRRVDRGLFIAFPKVEELYLGHNRISFIGYDSLRMPRLRSIRLNDNNIQVLGMHALRYIPQLQELDLSGNNLERFMMSDFATATSLRYLNVSRNSIRSVECDSITPMLTLEVLDLSSNNLTHLPGMELQSMEGLRSLLLGRNPIKSIGEGQAKLSSLQVATNFAWQAFELSVTGHDRNAHRNKGKRYLNPTKIHGLLEVIVLSLGFLRTVRSSSTSAYRPYSSVNASMFLNASYK
ncbi:hypothetical protein KIN20_001590 [Parelaphostrongylus tenuis]|uniref:Leucine Rich repeat-containing domain protein n=1 Tax=Parelaphostrongylus tenuis TaxID=148309 RepID=A0AAD5MCS6_PARTN|nr:hypothetical protein KIN20_001590 [Parelaphostrongylus tenuis]